MKSSRAMIHSLGALTLLLTFLFSFVAITIQAPGIVQDSVFAFDVEMNSFRVPDVAARIFLFFTYLASPVTVIILEVALFLLFLILRRRLLSLFFIGGLIAGESMVYLFKVGFSRPRPEILFFDLPRSGFAFPSGHALMSIVVYGFMGYCIAQLLKQRWQKILIAVITIVIIGMIGMSRVVLGYHWFSDVVGGWLLGGAVLGLVIMIFIHAHANLLLRPLRWPQGIRFFIMMCIVMGVGFFIISYYVTHPLEVRSTITSK